MSEAESIVPHQDFTVQSVYEDKLEQAFLNPPQENRASGFWWWFNNLIDKEGITRDLEEFKEKGLGSVLLLFTGNDYGVEPMPSGPLFLSPEWRELFKYALRECDRLGMDMAVNFCGGGWTMGGTWMTPAYSSRWYVQSQMSVTGPRKFSGQLPLPAYRGGYDAPHYGNVSHYMDWPEEKADYRDSAVVAFPESEDDTASLGPERQAHLSAKSNRKDARCFLPAQLAMSQTLLPWTTLPNDKPISASEVVNLTSKMKSDGTLEWDVPKGRWIIQRIGHVCIGCDVRCALPEIGYSLEIDWLNPDSIDVMFANFGKIILEDAGPLAGRTLKSLHTDSFEDGYPNWTGKLLQKFKEYRGYDPTPYLPVLLGKIVDSAELSDRFLYDYRKTVADCMANGSYGRLAERAAEHGLEIQGEAGGPSWSGTMCMDALKNLGRHQWPMGEFWQDGTFVTSGQNKVGKQTASAAHIYGRKTASAEAFTSFLHWMEAPADLKPTADIAFCEGINRFVFHTMSASRPQDGKPGYEYGAGTHFNPNVTWWQLAAGPWLSYVNRCQTLLQSGLFVADVLFYNGDWAPNFVLPKHIDPALGPGYDYDVCNAEVLLTRLSVKDGRIVLPDGMSYSILVLPDCMTMPVEVANRLKQLVADGATVLGPKPQNDPGLRDYPHSDKKVQQIADDLWGNCDGKAIKEHSYGKGRIIWGKSIRGVLQDEGTVPDFEYCGDQNCFIDFIHRRSDDKHIYFICNRNNETESVSCTFRVTGLQPELWNPATGQIRDATEFKQINGKTMLPLEFEPYGSLFVVFHRKISRTQNGNTKPNFPKLKEFEELTGDWTVKFNTQWGGPESVTFEKLEDWTARSEMGIKYYSGKATYHKTFDLLKTIRSSSCSYYLNLGTVKNVAAVRLNGKDLGAVWTAPWQVEITHALRQTGNNLEIDIVNLWPNRLIGDDALPPEKKVTKTNVLRSKLSPELLPSGLLGPVTILVTEE